MTIKKTVDYYMELPYKMEIVPDIEEGGFIVSYPDLRGCITCSDTIDGAISNALDAKRACLLLQLKTEQIY